MSDDAIYTARATVTGGRAQGHAQTGDGGLDLQLRMAQELGGDGGGTNPEELFAVGLPRVLRALSETVARRAGSLVAAAHRVCPYSNATRTTSR
jgi:organic hydroperoxide reductase OsmC/OhrA